MPSPPNLLRRLTLIEGAISSAEIAVRQCRASVESLLRQHNSSEAAFASLEAVEKHLAELHALRDGILTEIRKQS
jgi:hypothetical protein